VESVKQADGVLLQAIGSVGSQFRAAGVSPSRRGRGDVTEDQSSIPRVFR